MNNCYNNCTVIPGNRPIAYCNVESCGGINYILKSSCVRALGHLILITDITTAFVSYMFITNSVVIDNFYLHLLSV